MSYKQYLLGTDKEAGNRLTLQHAVFASGTVKFFKQLDVHTKKSILVVGCGIGLETELLAKHALGAEIIAIDSNPEQISQARERLKQSGISNIEYREQSVFELGAYKNKFDLVYCRFLLMNLQDPKTALLNMVNSTIIGGIIACEEGKVSTCFTEPTCRSFQKLITLMLKLGEKNSIDFDIGPKLYAYFTEADKLSPPIINFFQPAVTENEPKKLSAMAAREMKPALVKHGLVTAPEADALADSLDREVSGNLKLLHGQCQVTQIFAKRIK